MHHLPIAPPCQSDAREHYRAWLAHVEAGRIGTITPPSGEHLARHARNARVLAGGGR
ncbi:MAG: hypothetical protein WA954_03925 [Parerythrobacter sp.]